MSKLTYQMNRIFFGLIRRIRSILPNAAPDIRLYANIPTPIQRKVGDRLLAKLFKSHFPLPTNKPNYESALIDGLRQSVCPGNKVTVIGGGAGVTTVIAAQLAGPNGHVTCFEGGVAQFDMVKKAVLLNGVNDLVSVHHAFVGNAEHVYSSKATATEVLVKDLPDCDVLEMDCEGSELEILRNIKIRPRVILVESHGMFGSPSRTLHALLEEHGYLVKDLGAPSADLSEYYQQNDLRILMGTRQQSAI